VGSSDRMPMFFLRSSYSARELTAYFRRRCFSTGISGSNGDGGYEHRRYISPSSCAARILIEFRSASAQTWC
jgi:hypothetical protein